MVPIDLTYNFFATPIVVAISTAYIVRHWNKMDKARDAAEQQRIKQQEAKDLAFLQLMTEKERLKEDAVLERWRGYTTRLDRQEKTLCIIKDDIALMKDKHHDKVDWKYCLNEMEKFDLRLRNGEATA